MNRRKLLTAGPAAVVLGGTAAAGIASPAVPSSILDAGRRIAALDKLHEVADVPHGDGAELARISLLIFEQERFIIAATPATATEALVVLMVAAGHVATAGESDEGHKEIVAGMAAAARASHCLAVALGVTVAEFGGGYYLPAPPTVGRAA